MEHSTILLEISHIAIDLMPITPPYLALYETYLRFCNSFYYPKDYLFELLFHLSRNAPLQDLIDSRLLVGMVARYSDCAKSFRLLIDHFIERLEQPSAGAMLDYLVEIGLIPRLVKTISRAIPTRILSLSGFHRRVEEDRIALKSSLKRYAKCNQKCQKLLKKIGCRKRKSEGTR